MGATSFSMRSMGYSKAMALMVLLIHTRLLSEKLRGAPSQITW